MNPPIVIGTGASKDVEVHHVQCARCRQPIEIIHYADVPPLAEGAKFLCQVCLANHYQN